MVLYMCVFDVPQECFKVKIDFLHMAEQSAKFWDVEYYVSVDPSVSQYNTSQKAKVDIIDCVCGPVSVSIKRSE